MRVYLHQQGLDIVSDGDAHFDSDVGGQSWTSYPPRHMGGFDKNPQPTPVSCRRCPLFARGAGEVGCNAVNRT
jgi:hypothetical protein